MLRFQGQMAANKKIKIIGIFFSAILCLLILGHTTKAFAYDEIKDLTVTVGYWGDEEYTKGKVPLTTLAEKCGLNREIYTWIDKNPTAGTTEAEGIYLTDLMDYFQIDMNSVYYYNFYTLDADTYAGAMEQWTSSRIFGPQYTFKAGFLRIVKDYDENKEDYIANPDSHYYLSDFFNMDESQEDVSFLSDAWDFKESVKPMLALKTRSVRWTDGVPPVQLDFSNIKSDDTPQLIYGQSDLNTTGRANQAKMVYKVHIWFKGYPTITTDASQLKGRVGSKKQIKLSVATPDDFLSQSIATKIQWETSDSSVAKVDSNGVVTFIKKGKATISASYTAQDGKKVGTSVTVNASNGSDGSGDGTGGDSSGNKGKGSNSSGTNGTGDSGNKNGDGQNSSGTDKSGDSGETSSEYLKTVAGGGNSKGGKETSNSGEKAETTTTTSKEKEADATSVKIYEIPKKSSVLGNIKSTKSYVKEIGGLAVLLFLAGGLWEGIYFRRQVTWNGRKNLSSKKRQ